jgi:dTDP-4-dehydrorhamnose reductase
MKKNIAITGSSGLLGQYLCHYFSNEYNVTALSYSSIPDAAVKSSVQLDLTHLESTKRYFSEYQPDILIHAAGLASVDACEEMPLLAHELNTKMTANIVQCLNPAKTRMIHISTDHLFSGESSFYDETSRANPINAYAQTKYLAEASVSSFENSVVIRTNFYGGRTSQKKSFSNWVYDELKAGNTINLFNDVFFTPISVCSLAENLELLMNSKLCGIYNVVGTERITKFTFAHLLANFFQLNSELIIQSKISEASLKAPRPHDMSLSIEKIKRDLPEFTRESVSMGLDKIQTQRLI